MKCYYINMTDGQICIGRENANTNKVFVKRGMITFENTKTVMELVKNAGLIHDQRVFLRYEHDGVVKDVTYRKFAESCGAVAGWVEAQNEKLNRKIRVGVMGGSSYPYLSALLGVMSNGNVVVPLDVQLSVSALSEYVNQADIDYVFYDWELYDRVNGAKELCPDLKDLICLTRRSHEFCINDIWKEYKQCKLVKEVAPEECAMLLFTSGTTGKGKGVLLSHGNLIDNVFCTTDGGIPANEIYLNVLPVHHIFCLTCDFLMSLRYGNILCLNQDLSKLGSHIQLFQPTVMRVVPMIAKTLYNKIAVLKEQYKEKSIDEIKSLVLGKNLYRVICGGGYLTPELAKCYSEIGISIAQGYGMSECSPVISSPDWDRPDKVASVGKIVDGCQIRIVDGEIQVKSPSVMMGYYNDPEETSKTIIEDGWLRTGDLGYVDEENFLYFTGRCKNLIILSNGENVAPEQIENLFDDENLIEDILVFGEDDKICAEVYPNLQYADAIGVEDIEKTVWEIVQKHNQNLESYKRILQCSVRYTPFEKTSSKKIIRGKYFEQRMKQKEEAVHFKKPETETQLAIFNSVAESLGHQKFGIDMDLYEVGLDSLGSILLLTSLHEKVGLSITLQELSENATVEKLEVLANQIDETNEYEIKETYPLTRLQQYFGYVIKGNTTSNLPYLFKLDNSVDLNKLKVAVEQVFEVHPILKDIIQPKDGMFTNFRDDNREIEIPIIEITDEEWEKAKEDIVVPFGYTEGESLYHSAIYKTDSANYFFFDLAHIIGDGMSMGILFEDINAIYNGKELPKQKYTYYEYMTEEWSRRESGEIQEDVKYFYQQTNNLKIRKSILARKDSHDLDTGVNCDLRAKFKGINKKKVQAFCKKHGVTENVFFLTGFNFCVSVFANDDDILTTSVHSGRTDGRWNRMIGALFMTYYYRFTRKKHETIPEVLQRSAKQILQTMDRRLSNIHADEMFIQYQGEILNINEIGGAPAEMQSVEMDALPFHLQIMSEDKEYKYWLRYWDNRFEKDQMEVFMNCYEGVLQGMLTETYVSRLKYSIPEIYRPLHFHIEAGKLNAEAGCDFVPNVVPETMVKVYVFDEKYLKKPFGGWGDLYVMDYPTADFVDQMQSPYEDNILYKTGRTARITLAGNVEFLEDAGRTVMVESLSGREFIDLYQIEQLVCECEGVVSAEAYTFYGSGNAIHVGVDVKGVTEEAEERIRAHVAEKVTGIWVPEKIVCMGE